MELVLVLLPALAGVEAWVVACGVGSAGDGAARVCGLTKTLKARTPPTAIKAVSEISDSLCMRSPYSDLG